MKSGFFELVRQKVEANRDYLVQLIQNAVKINSYPGEEEQIQLFLKKQLDELDLETRLVKVDPEKLKMYKAFSDDGYPFERRYNLVACKKGTGENYDGSAVDQKRGRSLILNGHVDVVPPGDLSCWQEDPLSGSFRNEKIYGRGALDMKGGLAAGITAIKVLQEIGFENRGDIFFTSVCGEETGGCGAFALVEEGLKADACLILEPTQLRICHMQSGCHTFKISVQGRSIHACMAHQGVNAIDKFYLIYTALKALDRRRHADFHSESLRYYADPSNVAPFSVGIIKAGDWPSSVPDYLEAHGRMGIFPGESVTEMHRAFENTVREVAEADPWLSLNQPRVEWYEGLFEPAEVAIESDLVKTLSLSHRSALSRKVQYEAVTYGSDMRIFNLYGGIPTVMYGPGDVVSAHTVNESIEIEKVMEAVRALVVMMVNWCRGSGPNLPGLH